MNKPLVLLAILFTFIQSALAADITVSAAASLKDVFLELSMAYEKQYPQDKIKLNTAATGILLRQLEQGAPVDVFASADQASMNLATQKKLIRANTQHHFARNSLVLIAPKNQGFQLKQLSDLQQNQVQKIAIGNPKIVPAGAYAQKALEQVKLFQTLSHKYIYTQNVRQALDYVVRGEVQAGIVYRTDAQLKSHQLNLISHIPTPDAVVYPIAMTQRSQVHHEAKRFIQFILSPQGQKILHQHGFQQP